MNPVTSAQSGGRAHVLGMVVWPFAVTVECDMVFLTSLRLILS